MVAVEGCEFVDGDGVADHMPLDVAEDVFRSRQWTDAERLDAEAGHIPEGVCFGELAFGVRKLIEACEEALRRSLADDDSARVMNQKDRAVLDATCLLLWHERVGGLLSAGVRGAEVLKRTVCAERCTVRKADRRPEIHQSLVKAAWGVEVAGSDGAAVCSGIARPRIRPRQTRCLETFIC